MKIDFLLAAITYKCNAKCDFCDIWRSEETSELPLEYYKKLPRMNAVNITGGVPFMRKDIVDVVNIFDQISDRILISTNGLMTERIVDLVKKMPPVAVRISIDGIQKTHDMIRGIPGCFNKSMNTLNRLKSEGLKDLGISFTINDYNYKDLLSVYKLSEEIGVQFTTTVVHSSDVYFGHDKSRLKKRNEIKNEIHKLVNKHLRSKVPKQWVRAYFVDGLVDYVDQNIRRLTCTAGRNFFYLDPTGQVHACHLINRPLGNIREDTFEDIISSGRKKMMISANCHINCWMVCTSKSDFKANIFKVSKWIIINKMKTIFLN